MKRTPLAAVAAIVIAAGIGVYQIDTRPLGEVHAQNASPVATAPPPARPTPEASAVDQDATHAASMEAALASLDVYRTQIDALRALTDVDRAKVDVYRAEVDAERSVRLFFDRWLARDREFLLDAEARAPWRRTYGGQNQASLGALLESVTPGALGLQVAQVGVGQVGGGELGAVVGEDGRAGLVLRAVHDRQLGDLGAAGVVDVAVVDVELEGAARAVLVIDDVRFRHGRGLRAQAFLAGWRRTAISSPSVEEVMAMPIWAAAAEWALAREMPR